MVASCPFCRNQSQVLFNAKDYNRRISNDLFRYYRCMSCGLIFLAPIPSDLGKYYPNDYYPIPKTKESLASAGEGERYKIEIVKQFAAKGRLLEIGPAYGSFLYLAKQAGFEVEAIEMDPQCCRFISDQIGVKTIESNDPAEALQSTGSYDVITLWHVIEHLPDPWKTLEAISTKLQPGGYLVIAAPNPDSFQFRVLGRFWPHVDAPRHVSLIPLSLLNRHISSLGLKPVWYSTKDKGTLGWNIFGWVYFLSNMSNLRYMKTGLALIGRVISRFFAPFEQRNQSGSAYTAVFKKEI